MKKYFYFTFYILLFSCSNENDEILLETSSVKLNYNEEYQINADADSKITYLVENNYHASVSSSGLISSRYVGNTNILLKTNSDTKIINLNVTPEYLSYPEPELVFGETKKNIIDKYGDNYQYNEEYNLLIYQNYSSYIPEIYLLFNENDMLYEYGLIIFIDRDELYNFLSERYPFQGISDNVFYFYNGITNTTTNTSIALFQNSNGIPFVSYTSLNSVNNLKIKQDNLIHFKTIFNEKF